LSLNSRPTHLLSNPLASESRLTNQSLPPTTVAQSNHSTAGPVHQYLSDSRNSSRDGRYHPNGAALHYGVPNSYSLTNAGGVYRNDVSGLTQRNSGDAPEYSVPRKVVPNFALEKLDMGECVYTVISPGIICHRKVDLWSGPAPNSIRRFTGCLHLSDVL